MTAVIHPLDARGIVAPLLPSLPSAAIASEPATAILPLLSPIMRQRVQFLSTSSSEPWIRLLSYDPAKAARLVEIARSTRLEPHPISGEVEIDWDGGDVEIRYRRPDVETLQALVFLRDLELVFQLVYCETDHEGGGSGWRVGEVSIPDKPNAFSSFGGYPTLAEALQASAKDGAENGYHHHGHHAHHAHGHHSQGEADEEDDDDDYWARYDATPARTPAVKRSPAPGHAPAHSVVSMANIADDDDDDNDDYYALYDDVQPAMDNHDPDEAVAEEPVAAPFGLNRPNAAQTLEQAVNGSAYLEVRDVREDQERTGNLLHPRPASVSSHSSSASAALVAKLEQSAGKREQSEFGVKQHVSRSIKSLFMLARASGIDREEFEQLVHTELDMLSMMEDE